MTTEEARTRSRRRAHVAGVRPSDLVRAAVRRSPVVRAAVKSRPAQAVVQRQRAARVVRPAGRFLLGELVARHRVGRYRLRRGAAVVHLRHGTRDVAILNEVFGATGGAEAYVPPAAVAPLLADRPLTILDVGANVGLFGVFAFARWDVDGLHSFEPDPANARLLRRTVDANGLGGRWRVTDAAVSNRNGVVPFASGRFSESRRARAGEPAVEVPAVDLLAAANEPVDLLKLDIEGGEWPILLDPRLAALPVRVIVMEWHTEGSPSGDPRAIVRDRLRAAGFGHVDEQPAEHGRNGIVWAWR